MATMEPRDRSLVRATAIGTILQLAMVISGHYVASIATLFAVGGMSISLVAGLLYARGAAPAGGGAAALGGAIAGGVCALLGIAVSVYLGDVTMAVLGFGTVSSAVTGAIGGLVGRRLAARSPSPAT